MSLLASAWLARWLSYRAAPEQSDSGSRWRLLESVLGSASWAGRPPKPPISSGRSPTLDRKPSWSMRMSRKQKDADRAIEDAMDRFGRVDIIVNAVGGGAGTALYPAEEYPEAEFDRIMDLNLRSDLLPTQAAVRAMIKGGRGGRVLHISSVRGQLGINNGYLAYVAAKGAINSMTRQQATEWAKYGITVNAIAPTFVATPQVRVPSRRREIQVRPAGAHPAQSDRRDGRPRGGGAVLLLGRIVVRDWPDPDARWRAYRDPVGWPSRTSLRASTPT